MTRFFSRGEKKIPLNESSSKRSSKSLPEQQGMKIGSNTKNADKTQLVIKDVRGQLNDLGEKFNKAKSDSDKEKILQEINILKLEHEQLVVQRNAELFGEIIPSQALIPYILHSANSDGTDRVFINFFDAVRSAEKDKIPFVFNNVSGELFTVSPEKKEQFEEGLF